MKVKLLAENAVLPQKAHESDAGYDLVATSKVVDREKRQITYGFGLAIQLPKGSVGLIFPRSSVRKTDLSLSNCVGVLDENFQGEIQATFTMLNEDVPTKKKNHYKVGERIAQLVVVDIKQMEVTQVKDFDEVSERGEGGFGSSGTEALTETKKKSKKKNTKSKDNSSETNGEEQNG